MSGPPEQKLRQRDELAKRFYRTVSANGNPSLDNLAAIISVLRRKLAIELDARSVEAAK